MQGRLENTCNVGAFLEQFDSLRVLAILLAALGAVALSIGAQFQNDAVTKHHAPKSPKFGSLSVRQILDLLRRPRWIAGTSFLVLAVVLQLTALWFAPLIVVQPVGVLALIITSVLNARLHRVKLDRPTWIAIFITTFGVAGFVALASDAAAKAEMTDSKLLQVVGILILLLAFFGVMFWWQGAKTRAINYIFGAGLLYGFVASLAKVVLSRLQQGLLDPLTILAAVALLAATVLGGWFVQNAYASGPPDLVIAGLTVIDPLVAVGIAIVILGEASSANWFQILGFAVCGLVSTLGVLLLSKVHPQMTGEHKTKAQP